MSTRIHWGDHDGNRTCNHAQNLRHREVSAAEFLKLPNLCRNCERAAQKEQLSTEAVPPGLAAYERHRMNGTRQTIVVA